MHMFDCSGWSECNLVKVLVLVSRILPVGGVIRLARMMDPCGVSAMAVRLFLYFVSSMVSCCIFFRFGIRDILARETSL